MSTKIFQNYHMNLHQISDVTISEIHLSHDLHSGRITIPRAKFEEVSHDFGVGLVAGNPNHDLYRIESKWGLLGRIPSNYIAKSGRDPRAMFYSPDNDDILKCLQHQFIDLPEAWKQLIGDITRYIRYTCIHTNRRTRIIYQFNHLDFLKGLINGLNSTRGEKLINEIMLFDRCRLCKVNLKRVLYTTVDDIIKVVKQVLNSVIVLDLFEIIGKYCTPILPLIDIDSIQYVTREEYPMVKYIFSDSVEH